MQSHFIRFKLTIILAFGVLHLASQQVLKGTIVDKANNEPLIGASVFIPETKEGTITDIDGKFSLDLKPGSKTARFSYTGYKDILTDISALDLSNLTVSLESGINLDEVLVVGYGIIDKSDKTGAIESIKPLTEDVQQFGSFQSYLQGRAAGVQISSNGSEINGTNSIRIRGTNSLRGDNEPLYVVDGIIVNSATEDVRDPLQGGNSFLSAQNGLTGINQMDIESIEILKDASATAIYGSRGANGVILITTKKGKNQKATIGFQSTTRLGKATRLIDVLDGKDFAQYVNEARSAQGFSPSFYTYNDGSIAEYSTSTEFMELKKDSIPRLEAIDWYSDMLRNSFSQNNRITASGGGEKNNYYIATGFNTAKGILPGMNLTGGDILFNYSHHLSDKLILSPRISTTYTINSASKGTDNLGSTNSSMIRQIIEATPFEKFSGNNVSTDFDDVVDGPRAWVTDYSDDSKEFRSLAALSLEYKLSDAISLKVLGGVDYRNKDRKLWYGNNLFRGRLANGEAGIATLNRLRYNLDNTILFKKNFGKKHKLNGTLGYVLDDFNSNQTASNASNFANQELRYNGIGFGQTYSPVLYDQAEETILSYLGRLNYTLDNKYLLTLSFRRDGSSKFFGDNKWSNFPSVALAWKIINEPFFKNSDFISDAKLRLGYGVTGNQAISPYQTFTRFGATPNLYPNGAGGGVSAVVPQNLGNNNLKWETTRQMNLGLDLGFLNDRVTASVEVYNKKTSDLLQFLSIGPSVGFTSFLTNLGDLENKGLEISSNAFVLDGKMKWKLFGNITFNRNKILNLGVPTGQFGNEQRKAILGDRVSGGTVFKVPANIFIEGQQAGLFWGYRTNGIILNDQMLANAPAVQGVASKLGDILYVDLNGDKNITDLDLDVIGNPNPDYTFGLGSEFTFKNFNLNLFFNAIQGNEIANGNLGKQAIPTGLPNNNILKSTFDGRYKPGATSATEPRIGYDIKGDFTDRMVEDGSFVRLSYLTLGYNMPKNIVKGINQISFFVSGNNLLLFTKYSGHDPEVNSFGFESTRRGIDWNSFPNQKSLSFGLNLEF
jgi:TonB-linked SusC/RagA family outer membrane protein